MTPTEHITRDLLHLEHITRDLAAIGCGVASIREVAAFGPWGAAHVILADGRSLLADYGPAGVHAWRWPVSIPGLPGVLNEAWSMTSASTAGDALAIFDASVQA